MTRYGWTWHHAPLPVIAAGVLRSDAVTDNVLAAVVLWALPFPGFSAAIG